MYKITIEKTEDVTRSVGREWTKVGQVEKPREERFYSGRDDQPKTYLSVETLNLAQVIAVVNGIEAAK